MAPPAPPAPLAPTVFATECLRKRPTLDDDSAHRVTEKKIVEKFAARCFHNECGLLSPIRLSGMIVKHI